MALCKEQDKGHATPPKAALCPQQRANWMGLPVTGFRQSMPE